ncbi:unnamed protein product (macronuclear) [Paramecium tetraurelia]|uniref:Uncharacterized protein n=1 Tax=Paramecium tetraurelia TaxID=5888 RepID=A0BN14_PARTE|nr:uncharacterized protein GSPATT00030568001 [Paramecium tetraurelia]CAK59931.1 unnamed protein product [Paramecium tetraurelia]|eukprot:XP_001427329.1 hypothetical protein (macronuclear) [Paramecium tetraurelia strain d4-2]
MNNFIIAACIIAIEFGQTVSPFNHLSCSESIYHMNKFPIVNFKYFSSSINYLPTSKRMLPKWINILRYIKMLNWNNHTFTLLFHRYGQILFIKSIVNNTYLKPVQSSTAYLQINWSNLSIISIWISQTEATCLSIHLQEYQFNNALVILQDQLEQ